MDKLFRPIDSLAKIIIWIAWWLATDAIGSAFILILTSVIQNVPNADVYVGLSAIRPLSLVVINVWAIYQGAKDITEFIQYVKSVGFRIY